MGNKKEKGVEIKVIKERIWKKKIKRRKVGNREIKVRIMQRGNRRRVWK